MEPNKLVTGVILAGGRSSRMGGTDKGLLPVAGQPMVLHALRQLAKIADPVLINANRNLNAYRAFGHPVIDDGDDQFNGPLAGVLASMSQVATPLLLTSPCDTPLMSARKLSRLITAFDRFQPDACIAHDGERLQPAFMLLRVELEQSLRQYLASGERKVRVWLRSHRLHEVDFSDAKSFFINVNTREELKAVETKLGELRSF